MLVDNSIVILDNIYRYREKGAKLTTSAIIGSQEMVGAISGSTFTTICVFAPVALFKSQLGIYGELFSSLAFTVVYSLTASLFVAIFLVPVLASKYMQISSRLETNYTGWHKKFDDKMYVLLEKLDDKYKQALSYVLKRRWATIISIALILVFSVALIKVPGFQLTPKSDIDNVQMSIELPAGTKFEVTKNICAQFEEIIKKEVNGYKTILVRAGEKSFHGFLGSPQSHKGSILITVDEKAKKRDSSSVIQEKLRKYFNNFPSVIFTFDQNQGGFGGNASPIDIIIKSDDLTKAKNAAYKIKDLLKQNVPEVTEPTIDLKEGLPQVEIFINRQKAYSLGLTIDGIGNEIKANIDGVAWSKFRDGGSEYDILVILDPNDRDKIPDLDKISIMNSMGQKIPLSSVSFIPEESTGPVDINRENQKRTIHVTGGLASKSIKLEVVAAKILNLIKQEIPQQEDLFIELSGEYADLMEYGFKLMLVFLVALALVYGVMAAQFESLLDPFIIMFTVPLSIIGVVWIHILTFAQLNLLSIVGIIVLAGVVVNNGIVLTDYTNLLIKRGLPIFDACVEAGRHRLRPILMTTLTTILGLLPMAFAKVEGSSMTNEIGKTLFGGLTVSTIFTLFLIPVIYSMFYEVSERRKLKRAKKRAQELEIRKEKLRIRDQKKIKK
jgi:HAE1 family hydrophobic/amphiphilic exporter-1